MRKNKTKTASQKRRARGKAKVRRVEKERESWVQRRLEWISADDRNDRDFDDETGDEVYDNFPYSEDKDDDDGDNSEPSVFRVDGNDEKERDADQRERIPHDFSIISWNVLADAYCSRSSHKNLPPKFQSRVFNRNQRQHQIRQTLRLFDSKLSADLIALQEVDPPLEGKKV